MKETIEYQSNAIKKRNNLVHAIDHNVRYLSKIHQTEHEELKTTRERLVATEKFNDMLQDQNNALKTERDYLRQAEVELDNKRTEM